MDELCEVLAKLYDNTGTQKQRASLHDDLRRLIRAVPVASVMEKQIQSIVMQLFANVKLERSQYLNAKSSGQPAIGLRLANYGQCLLHLFNVLSDRMKYRTIKSFIHHFLDILPVIRDILLVPLATIYLRILQKILASEAHRDHFDQELWRQVTLFCINSIECFENLTSSSYLSELDADMSQVYEEPRGRLLKTETSALLACLVGLFDWKAARLDTGYPAQNDAIVPRLIGLLNVFTSRHISEQKAMGHCLTLCKNLLHYTAANDLATARKLILLSVSLANTLWNSRLATLKDDMLGCLLMGAQFFELLASDSDSRGELHVLARTFTQDLLTRNNNLSLALADITLFSEVPKNGRNKTSFECYAYDTIKQTAYFVTKILALLHRALRETRKVQPRPEAAPKRAKLIEDGELNSVVDLLSNKNERHNLLGVQIASLMFEQGPSSDDFTHELHSVQQYVTSESLQLQMWSHICLASAIINNVNNDYFGEGTNRAHLWQHALRSTASSAISRSACHLSSIMLTCCELPSSLFGQSAAFMALDIVNRGPANVSDASISFVVNLFLESKIYNYIGTTDPANLVLTWFRERSQSIIWLDTAQKTSAIYTIFSTLTNSSVRMLSAPVANGGPFERTESALCADRKARSLLLDQYYLIPELSSESIDGAISHDPKGFSGFESSFVSILCRRSSLLISSLSEDGEIASDHFIEAISTVLTYINYREMSPIFNERAEEAIHSLCVVLTEKSTQVELDSSFFLKLSRTTLAPISTIVSIARANPIRLAMKSFLKLFVTLIDMIMLLKQEQSEFNLSLQDDRDFEHSTSTTPMAQRLRFDGDTSATSVANAGFLIVLVLDHFSSVVNSTTIFKSYFLQKDPTWLLSCNNIWRLWNILPKSIATIYMDDILEYLTLSVLHEYRFERSESTLRFVTRFLSFTVHSWAPDLGSPSGSKGRKIYEWIVRIAITARVASAAVRRDVIELSRLLLKYDLNTMANDEPLQTTTSVRTMLVMELNDDDLRVALVAAESALSIFDTYDISTYDHIYNDITGALASSSFSGARARLRLFCLSLLATKSEVIRSTALYHIIEMSTITTLHPLITQILRKIGEYWSLEVSALLEIHNPDIFHNWLSSETVFSFPFWLFGLSNMREFIWLYKEELVAQMIVLRHTSDLMRLIQILDINLDVLLADSAVRIIVYSRLLGRSLSQDLDGHEVLLEAINKIILPRIADQQSTLVLTFSLIHDCVDPSKSLSNAGMISAAHRATSFNFLSSEYMRAPSREPLQSTTKMFLTLYQAADSHLSPGTIVKCLRGLLNSIQEGMSLQKWQALRKLTVFLAVVDLNSAYPHAIEMLLIGLSQALDSMIGPLEISIIRISLLLLRSTDFLPLQESPIAFSAFLSVLRAVQSVRNEVEKYKLVDEIRILTSKFKDNSLSNIADLLQPQTSDSDFVGQKLTLIDRISHLFPDIASESARHSISALLAVLNSCEETASLDSAKLFCTSDSPMLSRVHFSDASQSQFANRVVGRSYLKYGASRCDRRDYLLQIFSRNYYECITRSLLNCLNGLRSKTVEVAEETLARCVMATGDHLASFMPADVFLAFTTYDIRTYTAGHHMVQLSRVIPADYTSWLRNVILFLLHFLQDDAFLTGLREIMETNERFASSNLVHLMLCALDRSAALQDATHLQLSLNFQAVFTNHISLTREHIFTCILSCHWARHAGCLFDEHSNDAKAGLVVSFLSVADAAAYHNYFFDAALFLHLYSLSDERSAKSPFFTRVQALVYERMYEPDSYYGVSTDSSLESALARTRYEHGCWKGLPFYAAMQSAERRLKTSRSYDLQRYVTSSFCEMRYDSFNIADVYDGDTSEACYESAWRIEEWHLPFDSTSLGPQQVLYRALCALSTTSWAASEEVHGLMRKAYVEMSRYRKSPPLKWTLVLATLSELEEVINLGQEPIDNISNFLRTVWQPRSNHLHEVLEPQEYEALIAARQVYMGMLRRQDMTKHELITTQLELLVFDYNLLSDDGQQQALLNATQYAKRLAGTMGYICPPNLRLKLDSLVANVLWQIGERTTSITLLHKLKTEIDLNELVEPSIAAINLLNLGLHASKGRLEKASEIIHKYLLPAIELLQGDESSIAGTVHTRFAAFCHAQFMSHNQDKDHQRLETLRNENNQEILALESLRNSSTSTDEKRKLAARIEKARALFEVDDAEYKEINLTRQVYLRESLSSFLRAFALVDTADTLISRCCALWFANSTNIDANEAFQRGISGVPSYKFVILLNQLLARLSTTSDLFQGTLATLLSRLISDHPYHSLYSMHTVQYSKRSGDLPAKDRAKALSRIMQKLMVDDTFGNIVPKVHYLCSNYVKLAAVIINKNDFPEKDISFTSIPNNHAFLVRIPTLQLPPLTFDVEPRLSKDYSDVPTIASYDKCFRLAGGISVPKIIQLRKSDGIICKELVKGGNDDLRQDVVMQQVFVQVDELFKRNRETARRQLKIRTYKVLPLTTNAGVLEWVLETKPMQELLQPLHQKYNPDDWTYAACRKAIAEVSKKSRQTRIETYKKVTKNCRPAMRYAFLDMFADAYEWYHAQLAYTRSTAAISIVGHVLGLGDRHLHNIILDTKTGEVVHIDLGIAFEQGRTLPIPERVPFRLTRDVVDGMGILGVEGVFRRCCEFTLEMMRTEQAGITSILDVLRYDPLYSWTLSPLRKHRAQERANDQISGQSKSEGNAGPEVGTEAARALLVVEQKLSASLSASAVVNELIREATDVENLALIFAGWSAWY